MLNEALGQAVDFIRREPGITLLAAAGLYLVLFLLVVWSLVRYGRLSRRQRHLLRGADGASLEQMLREQIDGAQTVRREIARTAEQGVANELSLRFCLQKVGVVRYDAFPDVGGEQSFSAALLDAEANGLVISGLFSRHDMRVYAKPLTAGVSPLALTDEERAAISAAKSGGSASITNLPKVGGGGGRGR